MGGTYWGQQIPPSWSSHEARNSLFRGLEASGDNTNNTMDRLHCSCLFQAFEHVLPHFYWLMEEWWSSHISGQDHSRRSRGSSKADGFVYSSEGKGCWNVGGRECKALSCHLMDQWVTRELHDTECIMEGEEGRNCLFGNRQKSPLKRGFRNEKREMNWWSGMDWGVVGAGREPGAAWSPSTVFPRK